MTNISKAHQRFSNRLNEPRVHTNPEEFLGPNYKAVLDFWLFLDDLTQDQWNTIVSRYWDFYNNQWSEWNKAADEAFEASEETIGWKFAENASDASAYYAACGANAAAAGFAAYWATKELIGMHILLEQQKPLTFFNQFIIL